MKQLLLSALTIRERLIATNKSFICGHEVEQFMVNLRYWLQNGGNPEQLVERWDKEIRVVLTKNFISKYNELKQRK